MINQHPLSNSTYEVLNIVISNPAAGADISHTFADNARLEILSLQFVFSTDATAGNRLMTIIFGDGTNNNPSIITRITQTASKTWQYLVAPGNESGDLSILFSTIVVPTPNIIIVNPGDTLVTSTANIKATDQFSTIILRAKRWITE